MITPADTALDEIQDRLTQIYNQMRFLREGNVERAKEISANNDALILLDRKATDYVALLAPQQEGIPAVRQGEEA